MRNCLSGYYSEVAKQKSVIVFVRNRETGKPMFNVEIVKEGLKYKIKQFSGYENKLRVQITHKEYFQAYKEYVRNIPLY